MLFVENFLFIKNVSPTAFCPFRQYIFLIFQNFFSSNAPTNIYETCGHNQKNLLRYPVHSRILGNLTVNITAVFFPKSLEVTNYYCCVRHVDRRYAVYDIRKFLEEFFGTQRIGKSIRPSRRIFWYILVHPQFFSWQLKKLRFVRSFNCSEGSFFLCVRAFLYTERRG